MIAGSGPCSAFKLDLLKGLHNFLSDEFRMALYTSEADLHVDSTSMYVQAGEASGAGYTAGGLVLRNVQVLGPAARAAFVTWDDAVWQQSTLIARGALIYNQTSARRAVAVLDFLTDRSSNTGEFRVHFPPPTPSTALIRLL
jgi:hypothetical protein